jgi:hypothetical protein
LGQSVVLKVQRVRGRTCFNRTGLVFKF